MVAASSLASLETDGIYRSRIMRLMEFQQLLYSFRTKVHCLLIPETLYLSVSDATGYWQTLSRLYVLYMKNRLFMALM
jgi:hypothetical protein